MRTSTHVSATVDRAGDQLTPPGSEAVAAPMVAAGAWRQQSVSGLAFGRIVRSPTGLVGLAIVAGLALAGLFAPLLAPYDPIAMRAGAELQPPSAVHPMGTDDFGRDVLSRVIFGSRLSLAVSVVGVFLSAASGISLGLLAGYFGGAADAVIMRFADLLFAFPSILLGIAVAAVLGAGAINTIWVVTIVYIPLFARLARASMLTER